MQYEFNEDKNELLKSARNICFEDIIEVIELNGVVDDLKNKNFSQQRILVVRIREYIYAVPYVIKSPAIIFLKTIYPSRKLHKKYENK